MHELGTYPTTNHYRCQENAWMDEEVMVAWVDKVLATYVAMALDHVVPLLILDSYRCHMMVSFVQRIQELGLEVQHIPGSCTSLCQPIDVGFNKPLNSLTPICLLAGTKNYPSVGFLRRNSMFFIVSAAQPQPTNNTTMVSFRPLPRRGFKTYTRSSANARWKRGWGRGWSKRFI